MSQVMGEENSLKTDFIRRWRDQALAESKRIAETVDLGLAQLGLPREKADRRVAQAILKDIFFKDADLLAAFGAASFVQHRPGAPSVWYTAAWARRIGYYLSVLSDGLSAATRIDSAASGHATRLKLDSTTLLSAFKQERREGDTLAYSLARGHGVTGFLETYIDSVLFTALRSLLFLRDPGRWSELGVHSEPEKVDAETALIQIVRLEVSIYTNWGSQKSKLLADESNLWWGLAEWIKFDVNTPLGFHWPPRPANRPDSHENLPAEDWLGAAKLVKEVAQWTLESPAFPTEKMVIREVTPEIICEFRSRLFIAKNAFTLAEISWPDELKEEIRIVLQDVVDWALKGAWTQWDSCKSHAYFVGLTLDILCHWENIRNEFTSARKTLTSPPSVRISSSPEWSDRALPMKDWALSVLGISVREVHRRTKSGELRRRKVLGGFLIDLSSFDEERKQQVKDDMKKVWYARAKNRAGRGATD